MRASYTKKIRHEPHVPRPQGRRRLLVVKRWITFKRDSGEEPSPDRVWEHICHNWRHLPEEDRMATFRELGYE